MRGGYSISVSRIYPWLARLGNLLWTRHESLRSLPELMGTRTYSREGASSIRKALAGRNPCVCNTSPLRNHCAVKWFSAGTMYTTPACEAMVEETYSVHMLIVTAKGMRGARGKRLGTYHALFKNGLVNTKPTSRRNCGIATSPCRQVTNSPR